MFLRMQGGEDYDDDFDSVSDHPSELSMEIAEETVDSVSPLKSSLTSRHASPSTCMHTTYKRASSVSMQDSLSFSGNHSLEQRQRSDAAPSTSFTGMSDVVPSGTSTDFRQSVSRHNMP
jgi:hypothetical protein